MIDSQEVRERAADLSLRPEVIEKDYVLGWILAGIAAHPGLDASWVFKGGTCLKKVHSETFRFSEDLDFTLEDASQQDEHHLRNAFAGVSAWVYENCGIELPAGQIRFEVYTNPRGKKSVEGRLYYRGPLRLPGSLPRIKLDLTADEALVLPPTRQRIWHPYSDESAEDMWIRCYCLPEIFAEKTRALAERGRPRDLYDVIQLFRRSECWSLAETILPVLARKCEFKGIPLADAGSVEPYHDELMADWEQMLARQLPSLPSFERYWSALQRFFDWLHGRMTLEPPSVHPHAGQGTPLRPEIGGFRRLGLPARILEAVRFAAVNHLCVELEYEDADGSRSTRAIEPYSLRRMSAGDVILHAERADGAGHRAYRVDGIAEVRVLDQAFSPRFLVELLPQGR